MIDGASSRPFSASTLPPVRMIGESKEKEIIDYSRISYATPRSIVEIKIAKDTEDDGEKPTTKKAATKKEKKEEAASEKKKKKTTLGDLQSLVDLKEQMVEAAAKTAAKAAKKAKADAPAAEEAAPEA